MTNQQILTKAIQKAIDGGFDLKKWPSNNVRYWPDYLSEHALIEHVARTVNDMRLEHLIFNHDFAKALWGEVVITDTRYAEICATPYVEGEKPDISAYSDRSEESANLDGIFSYLELPAWQHHLQQMVIAEDPIKYLATFIF